MENEFTVGQVFSKSFDVFGKNFPFMLIIGFLGALPSILQLGLDGQMFLLLFSVFLSLVMSFLIQGAVVFGVFQHLTGRKMDMGESFNVALRRFLPLLGVSLFVGFLTSIGYLFLIIPGIIISLMFWVVVPVTIVEKGSLGFVLQRSKDLTMTYRGRIFLVVIVLFFINAAAMGIQQGISYALISMGLVPGSGAMILASVPGLVLTAGLTGALSSVVVTVGYYLLREEVEGVAVEDLASVFE